MTNKTTKICCTLALLASVAATPALSQTKNFSGPSIAIGGGYSSQTYKGKFDGIDDLGDPFSFSMDNGKNDFTSLIDLSYGISVDKNFALAIGGTYDLTKSKVDLINVDGTKINTELKDHYSIYIQPTYVINDSTGVFGKLNYNFAKNVGKVTGVTETSTKNLEGWGYGLGIKTFLSANTFVQLEGSYVDYNTHTATIDGDTISVNPEVLSAVVSIGYKF
jgi:opacity protein-like surface antigen